MFWTANYWLFLSYYYMNVHEKYGCYPSAIPMLMQNLLMGSARRKIPFYAIVAQPRRMGFSFAFFFFFHYYYYYCITFLRHYNGAGPRTRSQAQTPECTRTPTTNTRVQRIRRQINNKKLDNHIQNSTYKKVSSIYSRFSSQKQRRST